MEITAHAISVRGPHAPMLRPTSAAVGKHQVVVAAGDPGAGHTALSLAIAGRLRPDGGEVRLDGRADETELRRRVAVVDTPGITEPDDALPVRTIVGEELAIAGRRAGRRAVRSWISEHDLEEYADRRFEHVPHGVRTRLLSELTVARPEVEAVVLTLPDRFGGDPHDWLETAKDLAGRGYAVLVTCTAASARLLDVRHAQLGSLDQPAPLDIAPTEPEPEPETEPADQPEQAGDQPDEQAVTEVEGGEAR